MDQIKQKEKALRKRERAFDHVYYIVLGIVATVVSFYTYYFHDYYISLDPNDWGVFGDFIGGTLNPLLAFFSFMLLLLNLKLQREQLDNAEEQLKINREELKLTREELKKAADAQADSAKVMNEQLKTQSVQQFEGFFFNLFDQLSSRINSLVKNEEFNRTYATVFSKVTVGNASGRKVLLLENQNISSLFIFLFQILKTIDSQQTFHETKKKYTNIIRSILPQRVLQLLMISCHKEDLKSDFYSYREIVEKYNLLEHVKFYESDIEKSALLLSVSTRYDKKAFDKNSVFNQFSNSLIYEEFEKEHNFYHILYARMSKFECVKDKNGNEILMHGYKDIDSVFKFVLNDVRRITEVYLNDSVVVDFRISDNLLHIKTVAWLDCFKFSDNHIVWIPSGIYEGQYFDNE